MQEPRMQLSAFLQKIKSDVLKKIGSENSSREKTLIQRYAKYTLMAAVVVVMVGISWLLAAILPLNGTSPTITANTYLMKSLSYLGLAEACRAGADFSLMDKKRSKALSIAGIVHKTYFKIDEIGAEAAAVTGLTIAASIQPEEGKKLIFDSPFLYGIIDAVSGLPLFLGIMDNPAN